MSHVMNTLYLESAYQAAMEAGFTEKASQQFAEEMLADGVPAQQWGAILAEANFWAEEGMRAREESRYV